MNRYFTRKAVTAVCFSITIVGGLITNVISNSDSLRQRVKTEDSLASAINGVEEVIHENVVFRNGLMNSFGYMQALMGKQEVNCFEVVQDQNGHLHYTYFGVGPKDTSQLVEKLTEYKDSIHNADTKFVYLMTPDKVIPGYTMFDLGLPYHYANETADLFLENLSAKNINYVDFRETMEQSGINPSDLFYKTDHNWKVETAFWAFGELLDQLENQFGEMFEQKEYYTDITNYNTIQYTNSFLGSMARKTGILYSGVDDFTLIYPKFQTDYSYKASIYNYSIETKGRFEQALIQLDMLRYHGGKYDDEGDKYESYLYGTKGIAHISNKLKPDAPKVLIVKDSFMTPLASFLSTVCSDIYLVDPRYYNGSIIEYTNSIDDLDYVMVSFTPQNLSDEFFKFN